jgi:hypothetical protein
MRIRIRISIKVVSLIRICVKLNQSESSENRELDSHHLEQTRIRITMMQIRNTLSSISDKGWKDHLPMMTLTSIKIIRCQYRKCRICEYGHVTTVKFLTQSFYRQFVKHIFLRLMLGKSEKD